MPAKQRGLFRTIGMRMLDFGRRLMRHYVPPPPALPPPSYSPPPPAWEADTHTPLIWNEEQEAALPNTPADNIPFEAPPEAASAPPPRPAAQRRAPARTVQRREDSEEKIDPRLLAILGAHQEREDRAAQIREERKATEIQRQIEEGQTDAPPPSRRRHRASFDYVETKPLLPPDEEISHNAPPKAPPAETIQAARLPDHEDEDDDAEESSPAGIVTADFAEQGEAPQESTLPPVVQRRTEPSAAPDAAPPVQRRASAPDAPVPPSSPISESTMPDERVVQRENVPAADDYGTVPDIEPGNDIPAVQRQIDTPPAVPPEPGVRSATPPVSQSVQRPSTPAVETPSPQRPTIQRRVAPPAEPTQTDEQGRGESETIPYEPPAETSAVMREEAPPAVPPEMSAPDIAPEMESEDSEIAVPPAVQLPERPSAPAVETPTPQHPAIQRRSAPPAEPIVPEMQIDEQESELAQPEMQMDDQESEPPAGSYAAAPEQAPEVLADSEPSAEPETIQRKITDWAFPSIDEDTREFYFDLEAEAGQAAAPPSAPAPERPSAPAVETPTPQHPTIQRRTAPPVEPVMPEIEADEQGNELAQAEIQTDEQDRGESETLPYEPPAETSAVMREEAPEEQADIEASAEPETVQRQMMPWLFPSIDDDSSRLYFDAEAEASQTAAPPSAPAPERPSTPAVETPTPQRPTIQRRTAPPVEPAVPDMPMDEQESELAQPDMQIDEPESEVPAAPPPRTINERRRDVPAGIPPTPVEPVSSAPDARPVVQRQPEAHPLEQSTTLARKSSEEAPADEPAEQSVDLFQALVAAGMVPPSPDSPPARPPQLARKAETASEQPPIEEGTEIPPEAPADVYQALIAAGMVPPPAGHISRQPAPPQEARSSSEARQSDPLPVNYASQPDRVMRVETETSTSEPSSSSEQGGGDVDIDKLARDVYSTLRNRLRIEKERRG
jgi:hypothetical protein